MNEPWVVAVVGGVLVVAAGGMLAAHRRTWQSQRSDPLLDELDRTHYRRRYRRRMQTSALIAVLGLVVGLSPVVVPEAREAPQLFGAWWMAGLLLAGWVIALALADILATRAHSAIALARIRVRQQELERKLGDLQRHRGNGDAGRSRSP